MVESSQEFRTLWLAVIKRAQDEAEGKYTHWDGEDVQVTMDRARRWLTFGSPNFCLVCELAGLSLDQTFRLLEDMRGKYGTWKRPRRTGSRKASPKSA